MKSILPGQGFNLTIEAAQLFIHGAINRVVYFDELRVMRLALEDVDKQFLETDLGLEMRFLSEKEVKQYGERPDSGLQGAYLREAIEHADKCFALLDGDKLASYGWYSTHPTRVTDAFQVRFDSKYVYMHHGYTAEAYRGKRLHAIGMARALQALVTLKHEGLVSIVARTNVSSLKSTQRLGYREFGKIVLAGAFGRYVAHVDRGCRRQNFSIEPTRPDVRAFRI